MRGILAIGAAAVLASGTWASVWADEDVPPDAAERLNDAPFHMCGWCRPTRAATRR